jgi:hypothetical protein
MPGSSNRPDAIIPERWHRIKALYHSAVELHPEQRSAFLDGQCAGDTALRDEVESLLCTRPNQVMTISSCPRLK